MAEQTITIRRKHGFTVIPNALLLDGRLTLKARAIACILLSRPPGWEYKVSGLCTLASCGRDAMRAALRELERAGYLQREQPHDADGHFASSRFVMCDESAQTADEPPTDNVASPLTGFPATVNPSPDEPSPGNPPLINTDSSNTDNSNPPKPPKGQRSAPKSAPDWMPERFARFWQYYPRGENKQAAIKAWDKLHPSSELVDTVAQALKRQVASDEWQRGVGIPYASTYLNQRRWEDEPHDRPKPPDTTGRIVETQEVQLW